MRQNCQFHSLLNTTYKLLVLELNIQLYFIAFLVSVELKLMKQFAKS